MPLHGSAVGQTRKCASCGLALIFPKFDVFEQRLLIFSSARIPHPCCGKGVLDINQTHLTSAGTGVRHDMIIPGDFLYVTISKEESNAELDYIFNAGLD
jgi:hypothetical protein